jgi:hypothetical protein
MVILVAEMDMGFLYLVVVLLLGVLALEVGIWIHLMRIYRALVEGESTSAPFIVPGPGAPGETPQKPPQMPVPPDIDVISGKENIQESFKALCEKYGLDSCTVASKDGLVVVSTLDDAHEEAARYSFAFTRKQEPDDPLLFLFGMVYKGQDLVGVVRMKEPIPGTWKDSIQEEVGAVLARWL